MFQLFPAIINSYLEFFPNRTLRALRLYGVNVSKLRHRPPPSRCGIHATYRIASASAPLLNEILSTQSSIIIIVIVIKLQQDEAQLLC